MRATVMEVSLEKYKKNMDSIQKYVGDKILMPVIKANGYGTYINKNLEAIKDYKIVALATVGEAVDVRKIGFLNDIFVLNSPYITDISDIIDYDICFGLSDILFAKELMKYKDKFRVHLEIETGMNRTGIKLDELEEFISIIKDSNIIVDGVYTHLSSADIDPLYTERQLEKFRKAVSIVKEHFPNITYIHSSASNGLLKYNDFVSNTVRPGLIMYGYETFQGVKDLIDIEPICRLKSRIVHLKEVDDGEAISYCQKYKTKEKRIIATIPIGYDDGFRRLLSNNFYVVVNGMRAPIVGSVCMDSCMIDVTSIPSVNVFDEVYIFDNDNITLEDIADIYNTINYEVLCTFSDRVPRIFTNFK